ncbi:MAG: GNAT family N-acetyltransferase [Candidatus Neomarinimicrobiota bacterium]
MKIKYHATIPPEADFYALFSTTGWNVDYKLTAAELYLAATNSWYFITASDGGKLVGSGRIVGDGIVHALILDLIVNPDYRRRGIGSAILQKMLEHCRQHNIRDIQLFAARGSRKFYEKNGFSVRPEAAPGMEVRFRKEVDLLKRAIVTVEGQD